MAGALPYDELVLTAVQYGPSGYMRLNREDLVSGDMSNTGMDGINVGVWLWHDRDWLKGDIGELIVYSGQLSQETFEEIEMYLYLKWLKPKVQLIGPTGTIVLGEDESMTYDITINGKTFNDADVEVTIDPSDEIEVNSAGVHLDNELLAADTAKLHNIGAAKLAMLESLEALSPEAAQSFKDWIADEQDCDDWGEMRTDMAQLDDPEIAFRIY